MICTMERELCVHVHVQECKCASVTYLAFQASMPDKTTVLFVPSNRVGQTEQVKSLTQSYDPSTAIEIVSL